MEELSKACNEHGLKNVWTIDDKISSRKMEATKQNYFMTKWNKRHVELWGERNFLCIAFFTQEGVRGLFSIIWD